MSSEPTEPNISLVIPAWNEAACLPRLLDTVEAARGHYQNGRERIEVIVADNCSSDETTQIVRAILERLAGDFPRNSAIVSSGRLFRQSARLGRLA